MNRSALKTYAPKARLDFIRAVTDRAAFFGLTSQRIEPMQESGDVVIIGGRAFPKTVAQQRRSLEASLQRQGFDQVMEAMAYTWFNRFVALRYMELHGYLDHGYRVLSHPEGKATPEIVEHAEHVTLPGLDAQEVINLKLDGTNEAELYRLLLVAQCNALHEAMPFLFEKIADDTELLLPSNLLHSDSVIRKLVKEIEESDWQQVEIIGWLYQFYISDKKDEVIGKVVKSEDIPAATQLFTPNWIVKYLVHNTLGRQWLATYPDSPLRQQMEYYIEPAERTEEVKAQLAAITPKSLDPETLTLLDPACGSGHILVEAYDLIKSIYQERGYRSKDIPRLILQKNLYGLEIDDRAAQLAAFALLMKARADDRRIFADRIQPNVVAIQDSEGLESLLRPYPATAVGAAELAFADSDLFPDTRKKLTLNEPTKGSPVAEVEPCLRELIKLFEHGKTFGSLIRVPPELQSNLPVATQVHDAILRSTDQLWEHHAARLLYPLVKQAQFLSHKYDAVLANPPYMGARNGMNALLKSYASKIYPSSKADLFGMFIERGLELTKANGHAAMVTMESWMFLPSFIEIRQRVLQQSTLTNLTHMPYEGRGRTSMGINFGTSAFSLFKPKVARFKGHFSCLRYTDIDEDGVPVHFPVPNERLGYKVADDFINIPDSPIAYWASARMTQAFADGIFLGKVSSPRQGMATGNNALFVRNWHEVAIESIGLGCSSRQTAWDSGAKWFPYNKGGDFRRWYGNNFYVIRFDRDAYRLLKKQGNHCPSEDFYFREGVTWGLITSSLPSFRFSASGFIFDVGAHKIFAEKSMLFTLSALLNSNVVLSIAEILNPTFNLSSGVIERFPIPASLIKDQELSALAEELINLSKIDWDAQEISWDYVGHPFCGNRLKAETVEATWQNWEKMCVGRLTRMKALEEHVNSRVIDAYELQDEVPSIVPEEQISITRPDRQHDIEHLISYAIGCMMGRFSLDTPGLAYAKSRNEGFEPSQYRTFPADADGIIPITDLAWFPDNASERFVEFIAKAWPSEHLEENLKFIADSLGPNRDEHPRDTIRRYLATLFYKDHLSTYKKRPIYWLFSSGKQRAFQCLVYLHRYNEGTLARMRTEYVIPLQGKIGHRIEQLAGDIAAATSTSHRRKLEKEKETLVKHSAELSAFDEKLHHYADQRIALDLDDGVKVNYGKFGDLLAELKAVTGGSEE